MGKTLAKKPRVQKTRHKAPAKTSHAEPPQNPPTSKPLERIKHLIRIHGQTAAIGITALLVVGGSLYAFWPLNAAESESGEDVAVTDVVPHEGLPYYWAPDALRNLTINPGRAGTRRFMLATLQLGLRGWNPNKQPPKNNLTRKLETDGDFTKIAERYGGKIRAIVVGVLSQRSIDALDPAHLEDARQQIRDRVNEEVLHPALEACCEDKRIEVVEVLFTELVVQ